MVAGWICGHGHVGDGFHVAVTIDCAADPSRRTQEQREGLSMVASVGLSMVAAAGLGMVAAAGLSMVAFAASVDVRRTWLDLEVVGRGDRSLEEIRLNTARQDIQQLAQ